MGASAKSANAETALSRGGPAASPAAVMEPAPSIAHALVVARDRDPGVVRFEVTVVGFFLDAAEILGVPKSVAAIYGLCFASPEPLSFADINERLNISQGSISQGLRVLREVGALRVAAAPSSPVPPAAANGAAGTSVRRVERFTPDLELRKLASRWLEQRLERQLKAGKSRLQAMKDAVPADRPGAAKELKARLKYLESWHVQSRALVPLIKTFLKLT